MRGFFWDRLGTVILASFCGNKSNFPHILLNFTCLRDFLSMKPIFAMCLKQGNKVSNNFYLVSTFAEHCVSPDCAICFDF